MAIARRTGYVVQSIPRYCTCDSPKHQLSTHAQLGKAIAKAKEYWDAHLHLFGQLVYIADIIVINASDGVIEWRNGKPTKEGSDSGQSQGANRAGTPTGVWLAERRLWGDSDGF